MAIISNVLVNQNGMLPFPTWKDEESIKTLLLCSTHFRSFIPPVRFDLELCSRVCRGLGQDWTEMDRCGCPKGMMLNCSRWFSSDGRTSKHQPMNEIASLGHYPIYCPSLLANIDGLAIGDDDKDDQKWFVRCVTDRSKAEEEQHQLNYRNMPKATPACS